MAEDFDFGRLMGTIVTSNEALAAEMRGVHDAILASLAATRANTGSSATARRARAGMKLLAGGADPSAGQTAAGAPAALGPVDPGAGRLGSAVPTTVEQARGNAYRARASMIFNALAGTTGGHGGGPQQGYGGQGGWGPQQGPGGGSGGIGTYVPGYGYYGGAGAPYGMGGGAGQGRPGGGIPPSGGGGGHSSHLGLLGTVASRVPVVGLAVRGVEEALSQREKNSYYQNVEGGSNASGFAERAHEELYRWSTAGMFSAAESREAFKGVTRIGYNNRSTQSGPGRQDALNFVYHGKSSYGATVDESLMTLQEASKSPLLALNALSGALKQLSDDAGAAGVNAQMARSHMVGLMTAAIGAGYGSGSVSAASSIQDTLSSYGKSYADTSGAGQLTPGFARYAAAQAGLTYGQLTNLQKTSPAKAAAIRTGVGLQGAAQVLTPDMQAFIAKRIGDYGGNIDERLSLMIASDFLTQFGRQVDPEVMTGQLSALTGMAFTDFDHALGWVAQQMAGNTEAARAANSAPASYSGLGVMSTTQAAAMGLTPSLAVKQRINGKVGSVKDYTTPGDYGQKTLNSYMASANVTGRFDPAIAALLQAVDTPTQQKVAVHTPGGLREMSLSDAILNHGDEIASGQVTFTSGKYKGKTVADLIGSKADSSRAFMPVADTLGSPISQADFAKAAGAPAAGSHVTIDLSADARRLLTVMGASGTAGAAGEAAPPVNPYAANPSTGR